MSHIPGAVADVTPHPGSVGVASPRGADTDEGPATGFSIERPLLAEEEMVRLHFELEALLPDRTRRAVQFIGSHDGEGTSTIAREFAVVSATRFGQSVLFLEFDSYREGGAAAASTFTAPTRIAGTTLSVGMLAPAFTIQTRAVDADTLRVAWDRLSQAYELIVVDAPPASQSPEGLAVVKRVNGVVLVMGAETTRWPVAARTRDNVIRNGGRVLGIVFNKRRYYIPSFIYNWL